MIESVKEARDEQQSKLAGRLAAWKAEDWISFLSAFGDEPIDTAVYGNDTLDAFTTLADRMDEVREMLEYDRTEATR